MAPHTTMSQHHPDLATEQAFIDHAYHCLEQSKVDAWKMRGLHEGTLGGTFQARYERDVFDEAVFNRLTQLDLGTAALVFGRIDRTEGDRTDDDRADARAAGGVDVEGAGVESFHIGRLAVADENSDPVVVDWRAPVAEPFYRATGRDPLGLVRRRHFHVQGRQLLGLEDELFGDGHLGIGAEGDPVVGTAPRPDGIRGYSTLLAALERGRTGQLGDIVATIQGEQDEIIRSPQAGVLVVQGGPGTGKTVVALHRAAYLLYTFRFPLEDQGVLVIGPNRVFLRYIERVLPSLGEAGVEQVVLADLVHDVQWARYAIDPPDNQMAARVKGDLRISLVIDKAVTDRERPLRDDLVVPFRTGYVRLRAAESARIVRAAQRRFRKHNAARRWVEGEVWAAMAAGWHDEAVTVAHVKEAVRALPEVRAALERMWPVLSPAQLLHDLYGSRALLKLAGAKHLSEAEYLSLYRDREADVVDVRWTEHDVAILDEARSYLGARPAKGTLKPDEADEIRTYGHIVVDEVQDLTPMQLRMVSRRSLNGSMTVVGDIAQATGALAPDDWDDILRHLPATRGARVIGLSVGYRIPAQIMELANKVMMAATPSLRAPTSVRAGDEHPEYVHVAGSELLTAVVAATKDLDADVGEGNIAIVVPDAMFEAVSGALAAAGIEHGKATRTGLEMGITVVPVSVVKGLELDGVVVVEPADIVAGEQQGLRALYVALTRSTKRLTIVHAKPLPAAMQ
ncbi:MAG: AAA family ATPase [Ilumatobacteraceae bacterium]|nr:AAA family ATPase [Ilumatobacteraceae bacterium]MBP8208265.1 AAA family ATPase [Ilumatobacteraceae bacterium]MBP9052386.1 AAA family ATPase [Ilumatobacteraceae bacterium]